MNNKLRIKITGKTKKYFLNELIKRKINIYDIKEEKNKYEIIINNSDYEKILNIKTTNQIEIINRIGLNKYVDLIKKNFITIIFIILGIILNILLSNMILDINIEHSNNEIKNVILDDLSKYGIKKYKLKVSYEDKEKIKNKILEKEKDKIEWLEIEEVGCRYIIKLEERKNNEKITCNPRNIISTKKAIITKITSENGEIVKKINDYVIPGDVLISGIIYNKEKAVDKKCAIGNVYGETWYKIKITFNNKYKNIEETNNIKKGFAITFFKINYMFFNNFSNYKIKEYNIIDSKILPIKISFTNYQELIVKNNKNTISNIDEKALEIAEKNIKNKLDKYEKILTKKVLKKTLKNSKIEVDVFISTEENITAYQDITVLNIDELNKE